MSLTRTRLKTLLVALAAALAVLVVPDAARAAEGPVSASGADVSLSLQLAEAHWGAAPCRGQVSVTWGRAQDASANGTSRWSNPDGTESTPADNTDCVVELNPAASWDWPKLCTVVAHELGHLLGHDHAADPADLMAPVYAAPLPECAGTPEPEGLLGGAAAAPAPDAAAPAPAPAPAVAPAPAPVAAAAAAAPVLAVATAAPRAATTSAGFSAVTAAARSSRRQARRPRARSTRRAAHHRVSTRARRR